VTGVVLENVGVSYGDRPVVRELTMSVRSGEWLGVIGPNGAGKTTILRAIAGLVTHVGRIAVGDVVVEGSGLRRLARRVAMVHQDPVIPAGMTVSQYVLLGRSPYLSYAGREGARDRRVVADVLERLSLGSLAARRVDECSGGERRRAAVARALAQQAPVLLLDEPTSSLDVGRQQEVLELVDDLRRSEELTVIAAMHDLTLAAQFAERLTLLVAGRVVSTGSAADVLTEEAIRRHFDARVRVLPLDQVGPVVVPVRGETTMEPAQ
jgi:iron complex transport system ATP-binding protein